MVSIKYSGALGEAVEARVGEQFRMYLAESNRAPDDDIHIYISDSIDFTNCIAHSDVADRTLLCFLTSHALIVTPWIGKNCGTCGACFVKRYMANLLYWEHTPQIEETLQRIERSGRSPRRFDIPESVASLTISCITERLANEISPTLWYIDLIHASFQSSAVIPVHGCITCFGGEHEKNFKNFSNTIRTIIGGDTVEN